MGRHELRWAGFGGQGVLTMGSVFGRAAVLEAGWDAVLTEAYGPQVTGGWSRADLVLDPEGVDYPLVTRPEVLVAMSQDGLQRNVDTLGPEGLILGEAELVSLEDDPRFHPIDAIAQAEELGFKVVANSIMIGALAAARPLLDIEQVRAALHASVPPKTVELNDTAFQKGLEQGEAILWRWSPGPSSD